MWVTVRCAAACAAAPVPPAVALERSAMESSSDDRSTFDDDGSKRTQFAIASRVGTSRHVLLPERLQPSSHVLLPLQHVSRVEQGTILFEWFLG